MVLNGLQAQGRSVHIKVSATHYIPTYLSAMRYRSGGLGCSQRVVCRFLIVQLKQDARDVACVDRACVRQVHERELAGMPFDEYHRHNIL